MLCAGGDLSYVSSGESAAAGSGGMATGAEAGGSAADTAFSTIAITQALG